MVAFWVVNALDRLKEDGEGFENWTEIGTHRRQDNLWSESKEYDSLLFFFFKKKENYISFLAL